MPTFFVPPESITPPIVRITGPLLRHLRDSLRLQQGEALTVLDDRGNRYRTEVTTVTDREISARILQTMAPPLRTRPSLVLAQALLKGEKMDWVIQKATELGVDHFVPLHAKHSVVKLRQDRIEHQMSRWQRIAVEAAQQSERWTVPTLDTPMTFSELLTRYQTASTKLFLAERSNGSSLQSSRLPADVHDTVLLVIGPEGGWDPEEVTLAQSHSCQAVTMGATILRAETAAIAAISSIQSRRGGLGGI